MRGVYIGTVVHSPLTAAKNVWVLTAPANAVIELLEASIKNLDNETNEQLQFGMYLVTTAGVGSATPITQNKMEPLDAASTATLVHTYATTQPILAATPVDSDGGPSLAGYFYDPTPETRLYLSGGQSLALRIDTATFASITPLANVKFRIIG